MMKTSKLTLMILTAVLFTQSSLVMANEHNNSNQVNTDIGVSMDTINTSSSPSQAKDILSKENLALLNDNEAKFNLVFETKGAHNSQQITLFRFEPGSKVNFDQQNVSFTIDNQSNKLQGFVRLDPLYSADKPQVTKEIAEQVAKTFLTNYASDLLDNYTVNWIDKHSETIMVDNNKVELVGMKVKCRNVTTGLYFWVIVAPDQSVMVFERDIKWDFIRAGRQTEKWLHDSWLKKHAK